MGHTMAASHMASRVSTFDPNGSVWTEFSPLSAAVGAANLGQGFPNLPLPAMVTDALHAATEDHGVLGHQYARSQGAPALVEALAAGGEGKLGRSLDPMSEVVVTSGASAAIFAVIAAFVNPGDGVVLMEPMYDSYPAAVELAGGVTSSVPLRWEGGEGKQGLSHASGWTLDLEELDAAVGEESKVLVVNTPHNPTGKVFTKEELEGIAAIAIDRDLIVLADEVYDTIVYPGASHVAIASLPGMAERTITIGSAGKTFSVTGWRLGWALGPPDLLSAMWLVNQYITFASTTPIQNAIASLLNAANAPDSTYYADTVALLETKRDQLVGALASAGMDPIVPEGSYFALANTSGLGDGPFPFTPVEGVPVGASNSRDYQVARWLTQTGGVTAIPPSAFYMPEHAEEAADFVRFCFCKDDATLDAAIQRLATL